MEQIFLCGLTSRYVMYRNTNRVFHKYLLPFELLTSKPTVTTLDEDEGLFTRTGMPGCLGCP